MFVFLLLLLYIVIWVCLKADKRGWKLEYVEISEPIAKKKFIVLFFNLRRQISQTYLGAANVPYFKTFHLSSPSEEM